MQFDNAEKIPDGFSSGLPPDVSWKMSLLDYLAQLGVERSADLDPWRLVEFEKLGSQIKLKRSDDLGSGCGLAGPSLATLI